MATTDPNAAATGEGIFGLSSPPDAAAVVLFPVPFDATTSYRTGAAQGPAAILDASAQVDLHDREVGDPWRAGMAFALFVASFYLSVHSGCRSQKHSVRSRAIDDLVEQGRITPR
jgi:arginase family enzyme